MDDSNWHSVLMAMSALRATAALLFGFIAASGCSSNDHPDSAPDLSGAVEDQDPAPLVAVAVKDLIDDSRLDAAAHEVLTFALEHTAAMGETVPGSYEPLIGFVPSTRAPSSGEVLSPPVDRHVSGHFVVANPSNRGFAGTVLCLRALTQVDCGPTSDRFRVDLAPERGSIIDYDIPVEIGDLISFVLLVDDDRMDPLPASRVTSLVAASTWSDWNPEYGAPELGTCHTSVWFSADETRPGHVDHDTNVDLTLGSCDGDAPVVLLFANRRALVAHATFDGDRWRIPEHVTRSPDVSSVQAIAFSAQPVGDSSGAIWIEPMPAEELIID